MLSKTYGSSFWFAIQLLRPNVKSVSQFWVLLSCMLIHSFNLQVNFEDEARIKFLKLLGFSKDELERKVSWLLLDCS